MKALLSEIKSLLADSFPELAASLNPPAPEATIRRAEEQMGRLWSEELKELYRLHDGECDGCGLFFGLPFLSMKEAMAEWAIWKEIAEDARGNVDNEIISIPINAIRETYASRYYVPISKDYGGNNIGVDLDPGEGGTAGQVINFGRDEEMRYVIATSIGDFFRFMLRQLQEGNFVIVGTEGAQKTWRLKNPEKSHFLDALKDLPLPYRASSDAAADVADAGQYATWSATLSTQWKEIVADALGGKSGTFSALAGIRTLRLLRENLSDLVPLEKFVGLRELILSANPVRDITPLKHLAELKKLYLSHTEVSDIRPLQQLSNLAQLNLAGLKLADVSSLKALKKLRSLGLKGCTVPNLEVVSQLRGLCELDVSDAKYPAFDCLATLTNLTDLNLAGTNIRDLSFVASLKKLRTLRIWGTPVVDYSVLGQLPKLDAMTCAAADFLVIKDIIPRKIHFGISGAMTADQKHAYHEYAMREA